MTDEIEALEEDLRSLESRKDDLEERIQVREKERLDLREAVSEGDEEATEKATRLRTELDALKSSRGEVAEKIGATRSALQRARREAQSEAGMQALAAIAEDAAAARTRHDKAFSKAARALAEHVADAVDAYKDWRGATEAFFEASHDVVPHFGTKPGRGIEGARQREEQQGLIDQLEERGVDLGDVLSGRVTEIGPTRMKLHFMSVDGRRYDTPEAEKADVVEDVLRAALEDWKRNR